MKSKTKRLILCLVLPVIIGGAVGLLIRDGVRDFEAAIKPPLTPPSILFPIVWTILYLLMGYALYSALQSTSNGYKRYNLLRKFSSQLIINYLWPIIFFLIKAYYAAAVCLVLLTVLVLLATFEFKSASSKASKLMIPYILWLFFALYLNLGVALLN